MTVFRPKVWSAVGMAALLAACAPAGDGEGGEDRDEAAPAAAGAVSDDGEGGKASSEGGEDADGERGGRLPDGVGEGGESGESGERGRG